MANRSKSTSAVHETLKTNKTNKTTMGSVAIDNQTSTETPRTIFGCVDPEGMEIDNPIYQRYEEAGTGQRSMAKDAGRSTSMRRVLPKYYRIVRDVEI